MQVLTTFLPDCFTFPDRDKNLDWARDSKWNEFLEILSDDSAYPHLDSNNSSNEDLYSPSDINGCVDQGDDCTLEDLIEYLNCLYD